MQRFAKKTGGDERHTGGYLERILCIWKGSFCLDNQELFLITKLLSDQNVISETTTLKATEGVNVKKANGPNNNPPRELRNNAHFLAPPLTVIFLQITKRSCTPCGMENYQQKTNKPLLIEIYNNPISLIAVTAKEFEPVEMKWVDEALEGDIDALQIGGISEIKHNLSLEKQQINGLPSHIVRWMATFLLDIT